MKSDDLHRFPDRELLAELRTFSEGVTSNEASYGLTAAMTAAFEPVLDAFQAALDALDAARAEEDAAEGARTTARKTLIEQARKMINLVRANDVSPELLGRANLDVYDTTKTDSPAPTSVPFAIIEYGKLYHRINARDAATPDSEAKPDGMLGFQIWRFIGDTPPASYKEYEFVALDTNTPYLCYYDASDAGRKVWYIFRWQSKNGTEGAWSETVEATING